MPSKTLVILSQQNSVFYGIKSIQHQAATTRNQLQNEVNLDLLQNIRSKTKEYITTKILNLTPILTHLKNLKLKLISL